MSREHKLTVGGLKVYQVELVGGPYDGRKSLCSHDRVVMGGKLYLRGPDDRYYFQPDDRSAEKN